MNLSVFERLVAIDDFQTFKKLMVKRNVELQLEALKTFRQRKRPDDRHEEVEDEGALGAGAGPGRGAMLTDAYLEMSLLQKQVSRQPP